jgi:hypothetical protein
MQIDLSPRLIEAALESHGLGYATNEGEKSTQTVELDARVTNINDTQRDLRMKDPGETDVGHTRVTSDNRGTTHSRCTTSLLALCIFCKTYQQCHSIKHLDDKKH